MQTRIQKSVISLLLLVPALAVAQLTLVAPNGGESLQAGSHATIQWTGIAAADTVTLEYSTDNGATWNLITTTATSLQFSWQVPNTISATCLVRVIHSAVVTPGKLFLPGNGYYPNAAFSSDGNFVIGASADGNAYIWDSHSGQLLHTFLVETSANIPSNFALNFWGEFSPDGKTFATVSPSTDSNPPGNMIRVFDATTGAKIQEWHHRSELGGGYTSGMCKFSPDGTRLAATGKDSVYIFNIASGAVVSMLGGFAINTPLNKSSNVPFFCDWNSSGTEMIVCAAFLNTSFPTYVRNNAATGDTIQTYWLTTTVPFLALHGTVHYSPDGKKFLAVTEDTTCRVWDVATGKILVQIKSNARQILDAVFSHDGKTIATIGFDSLGVNACSVKLWDAVSGAALGTVGTLGAATHTIQFSADDSRILISSSGANCIFQNAQAASDTDVSHGDFAIIPNTGASVVVYTSQLSGSANDIVNIPIYISDPAAAAAAGATKVTLSLAFNVTMLEPVNATPAGTFAGGIRTIAVTLPINANDTLLGSLPMRVALGNDSITKLNIINPTTDAASVTATDSDGTFSLLNLCTQGGPRLINPDGVASITLMAPNPASSSVTLEMNLIEDGATSLVMTDESGKRVRTIFNENAVHGNRIQQINVADLPNGRYFITLQTPTYRTSAALEVAR